MGIILSRFRKKISTKETLQNIQEDINKLEKYKEHTEQRGRKLIGSLVIYSFILCIIAAVICYFYYLPPTVNEKLLYATPFAGFIVLINLIKKILTWFYGWKVRKNERKLTSLKEEKKNLLEDVMETETYKVAKDILETFAPEQLRKPSPMGSQISASTPMNQQKMVRLEGSEIRRRIVATPQNQQMNSNLMAHNRFPRPQSSATPMQAITPMNRVVSGPRAPLSPSKFPSYSGPTPNKPQGDSDGSSTAPGPPMPRPILPRERGILDRFVEYLVEDGPSNRYALICRQCESHNGMALKEEFIYIAFRCAYCHYWNPARKQRPAPPKLETVPASFLTKKLEKESSSDEEVEERPSTSSSEEPEGSSSSSSDQLASSNKEVENSRPKELSDVSGNNLTAQEESRNGIPSPSSTIETSSSTSLQDNTSEPSSESSNSPQEESNALDSKKEVMLN